MTSSEMASEPIFWLQRGDDSGDLATWGKRCINCGIRKAWAEFADREEAVDGHEARCRECEATRVAAWRASYRPTRREVDPAGRTCTECRNFLPWEEFGANATGANGRRSKCKLCEAGRARINYALRVDAQGLDAPVTSGQ